MHMMGNVRFSQHCVMMCPEAFDHDTNYDLC